MCRFVVVIKYKDIVPRYHHRGNGVTVRVDGLRLVPGDLALVIDAAAAGGSIRLLESHMVFLGGIVDTLLEDWLGLVDLELGLEVVQVVGDGTSIGVATGVDEAELGVVEDFVASVAPVGSGVNTR